MLRLFTNRMTLLMTGAPAHGAGPGAAQEPPTTEDGSQALLLFLMTLGLLIAVGLGLQKLHLRQHLGPEADPVSVSVTELLAILLPTVLWSRSRRQRVLDRLLLWPPQGGPTAALRAGLPGGLVLAVSGVLLGLGWFYLTARFLAPALEKLSGPVSEREYRHLVELLVPPGGLRPLGVDLLCLAAMPALCEEILFRGALLPAMYQVIRARLGPAPVGLSSGSSRWASLGALLGSSLLFGAFHLSAAKLLPTAALGLGFGAAVLISGSLIPSISMHMSNNILVIVLVRAGLRDPPPQHTVLLTSLALLALGLGLWLAGHCHMERKIPTQGFGHDGRV